MLLQIIHLLTREEYSGVIGDKVSAIQVGKENLELQVTVYLNIMLN